MNGWERTLSRIAAPLRGAGGVRFYMAVLGAVAFALLSACSRQVQPASTLHPAERLLFSFERRTMLPMVGGTASRTIVAEHATHGRHALRLKLSPRRETVILDTGGFPMDWRAWRKLKVDAYRKGLPIAVNLRVTDAHNRRYWVWNTPVPAGASTIEYDLAAMEGKIDLSAVTELMWYAEQPSGEVYLDAVRLGR